MKHVHPNIQENKMRKKKTLQSLRDVTILVPPDILNYFGTIVWRHFSRFITTEYYYKLENL